VRFFETPGLDFEQRFQDALILAVEPGLIAVEQRERTVVAGERFEGEGDAVVLWLTIEIVGEALGLIVHTLFEESRFNSGVAREAPVGGGELMDEIVFGLGFRAKVKQVIAEMALVFVGGFIEEYDSLGGEAVSFGVEG